MNLSDFLLPSVTVVMFSVQGVEVSRVFLDGRLPPPIDGVGHVSGPVSPGEDVLVNWSIIKRIDCEGTNGRVWDGEDGFHLSEQNMPTGLPVSHVARDYKIQTKIPEYAPPGELLLTIRGQYSCPGVSPIDFTIGPVVMEVRGETE